MPVWLQALLTLLVALCASLPGLWAAANVKASRLDAQEAARKSASLEFRKVDQEAYDRAVKIWERGISEAEKRINALERELDESRLEAAGYRIEVGKLRDLVNQMKGALSAAGIKWEYVDG